MHMIHGVTDLPIPGEWLAACDGCRKAVEIPLDIGIQIISYPLPGTG